VADTDALAPVSAGERAVGLAAIEPSFDWSLAGLATSAASRHGGWVLNGVKVGVRHAADVDAIAVVALLDDEVGVFFVSPRGVGVEIAAPTGVDATCAGATVTLVEAPVEPGAAVTRMDRAAIQRHLCVGAVATAAEAVGAASKLLDLAVEYSLNREQFGRAIGRFQAVQHLLADAHVLRETAWSTTLYAAGTLDEGVPDPLEVIAIAKAHASRAARTIGELALQVFGGVAFTWEHDAHLFQRRILDCERRFGDSFHHERVVAERLLCGSSSLVS
jgi:alkylation response protein AidB-like acyl-CoA dehydrogenase